jgi:hypothetical protein
MIRPLTVACVVEQIEREAKSLETRFSEIYQ